MSTINPIQALATEWRANNGVTLTAFYDGLRCNDEAQKWWADRWLITVSRNGKSAQFEFSQGIGHRIIFKKGKGAKAVSEKKRISQDYTVETGVGKLVCEDPVFISAMRGKKFEWVDCSMTLPPSFASLMYCLVSDYRFGEMNFVDFCDELGYDADRISSLKIYNSCMEAYQKLRRLFSRSEIEEISEIVADL